MSDLLPDSRSELWVRPTEGHWRLVRAGTGQVLGDYEGRAEAIQEARMIAQREPDTTVKVEHANGTMEQVPLMGPDPADGKG